MIQIHSIEIFALVWLVFVALAVLSGSYVSLKGPKSIRGENFALGALVGFLLALTTSVLGIATAVSVSILS